jgi:CheY-like chemotaxis protein
MVFGFMEQSGGQIRVHSQLGAGTSVSLFFPRGSKGIEQIDELANAEPDACPTGNGERVLVVDDEPVVRKTMAAALKELGYQVMEAADGASALARFKASPDIQVLVTDIGLAGGMTGKVLYSQLIALDPQLRVLFVSGFAGPLFEEGLPSQALLLSKPFTMNEFSRCVSQLVRSP